MKRNEDYVGAISEEKMAIVLELQQEKTTA